MKLYIENMLIIIGHTLQTLGAVAIAFTVLRVHQRMKLERKIDAKVFKEIKLEQFIVTGSILLIIFGYILLIV